MPATLHVSAAQFQVLAEVGHDAILVEQSATVGRPIEAWILDRNSHDDQHRSMIIEQDGNILSDTIMED